MGLFCVPELYGNKYWYPMRFLFLPTRNLYHCLYSDKPYDDSLGSLGFLVYSGTCTVRRCTHMLPAVNARQCSQRRVIRVSHFDESRRVSAMRTENSQVWESPGSCLYPRTRSFDRIRRHGRICWTTRPGREQFPQERAKRVETWFTVALL